jgi:hypothetical protein
MNVAQLVEFAQSDKRFRDADADSTKEPRLVRALGWGVRYARGLVQAHVNPDLYLQEATLDLSGAASYLLGPNVGAIKRIEVEDTRQAVRKLLIRDRSRYYGSSTDYPANDSMRYWYIPEWPELFYGTATGGSATTIILPAAAALSYGFLSLQTNRYVGTKIENVTDGETLLVTDWDGATLTATVTAEDGSAITNTPDSSTVFSTYLDDIPDLFQPFIFDYALHWLLMDMGMLQRLTATLGLLTQALSSHKEYLSGESTGDLSKTSSYSWNRRGRLIQFLRESVA